MKRNDIIGYVVLFFVAITSSLSGIYISRIQQAQQAEIDILRHNNFHYEFFIDGLYFQYYSEKNRCYFCHHTIPVKSRLKNIIKEIK